MRRALAPIVIALAAGIACSSAGGDSGSSVSSGGAGGSSGGSGSGTGGNSGAGGFSGTSGGSGSAGNGGFGAASGGSGGIEDGGECAAVRQTANNQIRPVDIIWAIDNSGSMTQEALEVQNNMNNFAQAILNVGIDVHVALISEAGPAGGFPPSNGICLQPPLGNGSCPNDSNPPFYLRVDQSVGSSNSLDLLISNYQNYKPILRQNSVKYFSVVTDDNAAQTAQWFVDQVNMLDPGWFDVWKFFGVFCQGSCPGFPPPCAETGSVYTQLVNMTGGLAGSLCLGQSNFVGVFSSLANTIISQQQLDCQWDIPPVPQGEVFDKNRVNVEYTPGGGGPPQTVFGVPSAADCGPQGGWYYDDPNNPTKVLACPATCDVISNDLDGTIEVLFGCGTVTVPT